MKPRARTKLKEYKKMLPQKKSRSNFRDMMKHDIHILQYFN